MGHMNARYEVALYCRPISQSDTQEHSTERAHNTYII